MQLNEDSLHAGERRTTGKTPADSLPEKDGTAMKTQQVPNSPYFIHYDDDGYCSVSRDKDDKEPIPESEMQTFLDAVANGLLYIEKERKSRYQRIDEAEKTAFARGEAEGREDKLLATVKTLEDEREQNQYHGSGGFRDADEILHELNEWLMCE